jgi:hypothetical protein
VTLTLRFPTKWGFRTTQTKVNFASNWTIRMRVMLGASSQENIGKEEGGTVRVTHVPSVG